MKHENLYEKIYDMKNLIYAWKKARKGKTKKLYVKEFEENIMYNLKIIHDELKNKTYYPLPLQTFIIRDPKTRKISKADFRDRVVHHALVRVLESIFDKTFIYDSCANRKNKGNLFALKRFKIFMRKVSKNNRISCFVLKADIKHYFQEIDKEILFQIIKRKICDQDVIELIKRILEIENPERERERDTKKFILSKKGIPLGNLTSQFFANVYLNELDQFVKHKLKVKYYIRYVDDFVIIHQSKSQLEHLRKEINNFLNGKLKLKLHPDKSKIKSLSQGIDFVGFRNFYRFRLLRKRNIRKIRYKIKLFNEGNLSYEKFLEIFQGWQTYAKWADSHKLIDKLIKDISIS